MIDKQNMSEADIRRIFITPAIKCKWTTSCIREEFTFTDGRITIVGQNAKRGEKFRADYLLYYKDPSYHFPIAVVEAKDNTHSPLSGLDQAVKYATVLHVPFAFASNGDSFTMRNLLTGKVTEDIAVEDFPAPQELWEEYRKCSGITDDEENILTTPYYYREDIHEPRYFQWIAINQVLARVARGDRRMLIVLATGTGKTLVSFQIIWRLLKAKAVNRVLFLADRDILLSQPMRNDFAPFGKKMYRIDKRKMDTTHEVYLSLYHQLKRGDENFYTAYDRDFFDLVIVDECHRGSADEDSSWHEILEYFDSAIQVGMTATPKETVTTSNTGYFGEPVYTYSLKQGIDDGFLAPYKVIRVNFDVDVTGYRPYPGQLDMHGKPLADRLYEQKDFDRILVIKARTNLVAKRITDYLKETDRWAKTIVFCEDIAHAERMKSALINENADLVRDNPNYIAQITANSVELNLLDDFTDVNEKCPTIVVTSKLLSTGVNSQTCKLVVLDRSIGSMTEFKQIIGRGTRVREDHDKMFFTIMDFRKNHAKFADPAFDGAPARVKEVGEKEPFIDPTDPNNGTNTDTNTHGKNLGGKNTPPEKRPKREQFVIDGVVVKIINETVEHLGMDGKLITKSIIDYSRLKIRTLYPHFEDFHNAWLAQKTKQPFVENLLKKGVLIDHIKETIPTEDIDDYDILTHVGYNKQQLTKDERINNVLASGYLDKFSKETQEIVKLVLETYRKHDIDELWAEGLLDLPEYKRKGRPSVILNGFGGKKQFEATLVEIEREIYKKR